MVGIRRLGSSSSSTVVVNIHIEPRFGQDRDIGIIRFSRRRRWWFRRRHRHTGRGGKTMKPGEGSGVLPAAGAVVVALAMAAGAPDTLVAFSMAPAGAAAAAVAGAAAIIIRKTVVPLAEEEVSSTIRRRSDLIKVLAARVTMVVMDPPDGTVGLVVRAHRSHSWGFHRLSTVSSHRDDSRPSYPTNSNSNRRLCDLDKQDFMGCRQEGNSTVDKYSEEEEEEEEEEVGTVWCAPLSPRLRGSTLTQSNALFLACFTDETDDCLVL